MWERIICVCSIDYLSGATEYPGQGEGRNKSAETSLKIIMNSQHDDYKRTNPGVAHGLGFKSQLPAI